MIKYLSRNNIILALLLISFGVIALIAYNTIIAKDYRNFPHPVAFYNEAYAFTLDYPYGWDSKSNQAIKPLDVTFFPKDRPKSDHVNLMVSVSDDTLDEYMSGEKHMEVIRDARTAYREVQLYKFANEVDLLRAVLVENNRIFTFRSHPDDLDAYVLPMIRSMTYTHVALSELTNLLEVPVPDTSIEDVMDIPCGDTPNLSSDDYVIDNNCFYHAGSLVFYGKDNLNKKLYDIGVQPPRSSDRRFQRKWGHFTTEWFRFTHDDALYIFLRSGFDCGGCTVVGPYLYIKSDRDISLLYADDLPYAENILFSPDKKYGIYPNPSYLPQAAARKYHLYDFVQLDDKGEVYTTPPQLTLEICSHGCELSTDAIQWVDDYHIKIHPMKTNEQGYLSAGDPIEHEGEPIVVDIRDNL